MCFMWPQKEGEVGMLCVKCARLETRWTTEWERMKSKKGISAQKQPQFCNEIWFFAGWRSRKLWLNSEKEIIFGQKTKRVKWKFIKSRELLKGNAWKYLIKGTDSIIKLVKRETQNSNKEWKRMCLTPWSRELLICPAVVTTTPICCLSFNCHTSYSHGRSVTLRCRRSICCRLWGELIRVIVERVEKIILGDWKMFLSSNGFKNDSGDHLPNIFKVEFSFIILLISKASESAIKEMRLFNCESSMLGAVEKRFKVEEIDYFTGLFRTVL